MDNLCVVVIEGGKDEVMVLFVCKWDYIFYIGGEVVGKIVMSVVVKYLMLVIFEFGGKSFCFVDKNINFVVIVCCLVWGKWMNVG